MGGIFWNERIRLLDSGEQVGVLAIGDSWFHYPFNNLVTPLHAALSRPTIYVIGENGARADALADGAWRAQFRAMLADYPSIRVVAISAGGNDFAGLGDLDAKILQPDCSGAADADSCYRPQQPDGVFAAVGAAYRSLLADVASLRPAATVLVHNYDHAAGPAQLAQAADGQLPRAGRGRTPGRRAPRDRARADRPLHAVPRRTGGSGARRACRGTRLVGGDASRQRLGQRTAPARGRFRADRRRMLARPGTARAGAARLTGTGGVAAATASRSPG